MSDRQRLTSRRTRSPLDGNVKVPASYAAAAAYGWRLLVLAGLAYVAFRMLGQLTLVTLPVIGALLLTALLSPLVSWLRRRGVRPAAATWLAFLAGAGVVAGVGVLLWARGSSQYAALVAQLKQTVADLRHSLESGPLHVSTDTLDNLQQKASDWLSRHSSVVISALGTAFDVVAGLLLALFVTFFFLYQGERIWGWLLGLFGRSIRANVDVGGRAAWVSLVGFVRGTAVIATIHGVAVGISLWLMGVPLPIALAILVFTGSFIPLIGALLFGGLACLVALTTQGVAAGVALLIVLVALNQLEAHVLQPFIVGHYVHLPPLATGLALAAGTAAFGLVGALIAVPVTASLKAGVYAVRNASLRSADEPPDTAEDDQAVRRQRRRAPRRRVPARREAVVARRRHASSPPSRPAATTGPGTG